MPFYSISHGFSCNDSSFHLDHLSKPYVPQISKDEYLLAIADLVKNDARIFIMKYRDTSDITKYLAFIFEDKHALVFKTKQKLDEFIETKITQNYSLTKPLRKTHYIKT